jgi:VanZ family protein
VTNRARAWLPAVVWAGGLFALSSIPGRDIPKVSFEYTDKVVHAVIYLGLGALVARALLKTTSLALGRLVGLAGLLATAYGVTDELHQLFTPNRSCDAHDLLADAVGGFLGAWLAASILRRGKSQPAL